MFTGLIVLVAIGVGLAKYWDFLVNPWTRNGQVRAEVIQITPRVSGPIVTLKIKDNQKVNQGDILFEIDPRTFKAALDQAKAQYDMAKDNYSAGLKKIDAAKAQLDAATASVKQARSTILEIESTIVKNKAEYQRQQEMLPKKATSKKSVERSRANYEVAVERRKGAIAGLAQTVAAQMQKEADLAEIKASVGEHGDANASLRQAKAALEQAELNMDFSVVTAPVTGYVTNLNLRYGSHAVANQPALALVDISSFWVDGFFKETLVGNVQQGDKAVVTLMSYPDQPIEGVVDSLGWGISQQDGSTGFELLPTVSATFDWIRLAQRVPVKVYLVEIPNNIALRVGTTASVQVMSKSRTGDQ